MINEVNEVKMRSDLDRHFKIIRFPTHEKNKQGHYMGELQLAMGAGFAMSWREKQPIIDHLLLQLEQHKSKEEMQKIYSLIESNEHITKMDRKFYEALTEIHDLIRVATDVKDPEQLKWGVHQHLDFLIHGFKESDFDKLVTSEFIKLLKGNKEVAKREVRTMFNRSLQKMEMIEKARQVARQFQTVSDYANESLEDAEFRINSYHIIRAIGGIKKARQLLGEFKVDSIKVVHHADEVKKIIVLKDPEINLYDLYTAVFKVFSLNHIEHFEDKRYLKSVHCEIIKYIEKLNLPLDDIKATRAVKNMVEGKHGKKIEIDKSDLEFLIEFYDELKEMSPFMSQY